jgi:hypothetical protein
VQFPEAIVESLNFTHKFGVLVSTCLLFSGGTAYHVAFCFWNSISDHLLFFLLDKDSSWLVYFGPRVGADSVEVARYVANGSCARTIVCTWLQRIYINKMYFICMHVCAAGKCIPTAVRAEATLKGVVGQGMH